MTADDQRSLFIQTGHQDEQVDMPFGQNLQGLGFAGDRSKTGGGIQVDLQIFPHDFIGELPFPFDGISIIIIGDQKNFFDFEGH